MDPDARSVLERAQDGDAGAVEALLCEHLPGLRGFVRMNLGRSLREKEQSGDVVQSICREVLQGLGGLRHPNDASFRSWLYVTAARKIQHRLEHWRSQKREAAREQPLDAGATGASGSDLGPELLGCYRSFCTPSEDLASREEIERIEAAFDRLPEDHRRVIALVKVARLPHAEAARELGRSESATRMLLYRALAQLAESLREPPGRAALR